MVRSIADVGLCTLGLRFQIGMGSVIENTQIVFISESLNDFTPGVNFMTAPHVVLSIEVTRDEYLSSYVSDQVWQISGGEVVVAWDVDRNNNDRSTTQSYLDCYGLDIRVNPNHLVVESERKASATDGISLFLVEELRASLTSSLGMPFAARPNFTTPFLEFIDQWGEIFMGSSLIWVIFSRLWV